MKNPHIHYYLRVFFLVIISCIYINLNAQQKNNYRRGELILMLQPSVSPSSTIALSRAQTLFLRKTLSHRMNIHLYTFNEETQSAEVMLKLSRSHPNVLMAQFNHILDMRGVEETEELFPDDLEFGSQWGLHNEGHNGGVEDADIDAPEAWEITTGGLSGHGDTIVLAMIDEGIDLNHPDLNLWKNYGEIPDNGLDDDANGFVDDFHGWNAQDSNHELAPRSHGTHVGGIISALGNNNLGVSGVNWNTQLMPIQGTSRNEATLMEAYGYVLEMRKRYDESGGSEGAFVVGTNSSFGVNNGQVEDFPIWCALYDSLGQAGILNVAATANTNVDIEVSGDIPGNCTSDFLIIATNTTKTDELYSSAAYGSISVDMGAPGTQILSTYPDATYGFSTGTSMASPMVTGAIGLLLSSACPSLVSQFKNDPAATVFLLKNFLLQGTDSLPSLEGRTVTGGRLNLHKSLLLVQEYCSNLSDCVIPYSLRESNKLDISVRLNWARIEAAQSYELEFRSAEDENWIAIRIDTNYLDVLGLQPCHSYEYRVRTFCEGDTSAFSSIRRFTSEGCCDPPKNFKILQVQSASAQLSWNSVFAATSYQLEYKTPEENEWNQIIVSDTSSFTDTLGNCTEYQVRLKTICGAEQSLYTDTLTFRTKSCGFCIDTEYCPSKGVSSRLEWIEKVEIGPLSNESGDNNGYENFDMPFWEFVSDVPYNIALTPGFRSSAFKEYWRIWIDLNQNGDFEDSTELVFALDDGSNSVVEGELFLAGNITSGNTRMRVSMKGFVQTPDQLAQPCGNFQFGEVEDYCINIIVDSSFCAVPTNMESMVVNQTDAVLNWQGRFNSLSYMVRLREKGAGEWTEYNAGDTSYIASALNACATYEWQVKAICSDTTMSDYSESRLFETKGCGACTDFVYCLSIGGDAGSEWIESIKIGEDQRQTGSNNGYEEFVIDPFHFSRDTSYTVTLMPGFKGDEFDEYWRIWIDWNQDGVFDTTEVAFDAGMANRDSVVDSIFIPFDAHLGLTRMRVAMKFVDSSSNNALPDPCTNFRFGEVEDYCVVISPPVNIKPIQEQSVRLYPNPFREELYIQSSTIIEKIRVVNLLGEIIYTTQPKERKLRLDTKRLPKALYILQIETQTGFYTQQMIKQ